MIYVLVEKVDGKEYCKRIELDVAQDLLYCRLIELSGENDNIEQERCNNQSIEELIDMCNLGMVWDLGDRGQLLMVRI